MFSAISQRKKRHPGKVVFEGLILTLNVPIFAPILPEKYFTLSEFRF